MAIVKKHHEIAVKMIDWIDSKALRPGDRLPSERQFASLFGINRITLGRSLAFLLGQGKIARFGNKLVVAQPKKELPLSRITIAHPFGYQLQHVPQWGWLFEDPVQVVEKFGCVLQYEPCPRAVDERALLQKMMTQPPDGLVFWPGADSDAKVELDGLKDKLSLIVCDLDPGKNFNFISTDHKHGSRLAVDHLIKLRHRELACISLSPRIASIAERVSGYRESCLSAGLRASADRLVVLNRSIVRSSYRNTLKKTQELFDNHAGVTGLVCTNDEIAAEVTDALKHLGKRVPQDVSVCGFDGGYSEFDPPLTSVAQDFNTVIVLALEMVLTAIHDKSRTLHSRPHRIRVEPYLVARSSTGFAPQTKR